MRSKFVAEVARKIEGVAVSVRWIPSMSRKAGAVDFLTGPWRIRAKTQLLCFPAAALLVSLSACAGQTVLRGLTPQTQEAEQPTQPAKVAQAAPPANPAHRASKPDPKAEPTQQELFEYIRGRLLSLSPTDGFNDNLEVAFDPATSTLSVTQPDGRCDIFLNALDTNSAIWEVIDPSDTYHAREEILRLTMTSSSEKRARTCYDNQNQIDKSIAANRVRLLFSQNKASAVPDFAFNMTKAIKKLVVASGGAPEKKIYLGNP
jgi:hypothetical protein